MGDTIGVELSPYSDKDELLPGKEQSSRNTIFSKQNEGGFESPRGSLTSSFKSCVVFFSIFGLITASVLGFLTIQDHAYSKLEAPISHHCDHAMTRPSFHTLMPHRRHALTIAINRLMDTPSRLGLNTSLYDDFTYIHIQLKNSVHHSAISLPWHRLFIHVFENALRTEGHYDGYLPYWDWTLDANDPLSSPIWDNRTGFGGNGTGPDNCVQEGILGKYIAKYNEWEYDEHCVKRKFEDSVEDGMMHGKQWGKEVVKDIVKGSKTYGEFRERLESGPHKHLHLGIRGEMFGIGSTNDPLFFVHHTQVDRLWWLWQQQNPSERNHEYFGPQIEESDISTEEASIEDQVLMLGMGQDRSVRDLLTTNTDILCYKYAMDI